MNTNAIHWQDDDSVGMVDASDLGLPPGHWPDTINVNGRVYTKTRTDRGRWYDYVNGDGTRITVFND
jgi:hypothetical protein